MKKLILGILATTLLFSCTAEDNTQTDVQQGNTLQIPDRFVGDWVGSYGNLTKIENNSISIEVNSEVITRTRGEKTVDNGTTLAEFDLENGEHLVLLYRANGANTLDDDVIGITLYRGDTTVTSTFYTRH